MSGKMLEKNLARKETSKIIKVEEFSQDYTVTKTDGWSFAIPKKYGVIPKVDDEIIMYGEPFQVVQGVDINHREVFFKTKAELEDQRQRFIKAFHEKQIKDYQEIIEKIKNDEHFETIDISGMGGSYEWGCQMMLQAGIKFLKEHPEFHFDYQEFKNVYGFCWSDTPWAKDLDKVLMDAVGGDSTGAMHQAVIHHLFYIHKYGYQKWLETSKKRRYTYPLELPKPS